MAFSKEERRILEEMEQALREPVPPPPASRVPEPPHLSWARAHWAEVTFIVGFIVLLFTFGSSVLVGVLGFLVMLVSALVFMSQRRRRG